MSTLFKRAAICTDIHFGLKSNSTQHNEDCLDFIHWFTTTAKEQGCETCFFLGDWHNNRASLNIVTLNYSLRALEHLSANFTTVYFIPGNHDLYYRDRRDVQSVEWARHLPNVVICNDWQQIGDVVIAPWLIGQDYKRIPKLKGKYMFGHFELPHFYMNAMVQMPDHGEVKADLFKNFDRVYTGHFHKRQTRGNITYIGNCFPHNYADAGDDDRGMLVLDWDGTEQYFAWPKQPKYRVYDLGELLEEADAAQKLLENMHVRVNLDIDISYEEASFLRDTFLSQYKLREISLLPKKNTDLEQYEIQGNVNFESVDQIVINQLTNIVEGQFDKKLLLDIYRNL